MQILTKKRPDQTQILEIMSEKQFTAFLPSILQISISISTDIYKLLFAHVHPASYIAAM